MTGISTFMAADVLIIVTAALWLCWEFRARR